MKRKIKFDCLFESGKRKNLILEMEFPEFLEYKSSFCGIETINSVDNQIIDYLDSIDKSEMMHLNNIQIIFNYSIHNIIKNVKNKSIIVLEALKELSKNNSELYLDFCIVYDELRKNIKNRSIQNQINTVIKTYNLMLQSKIVAYEHIIETNQILRNIQEEDSNFREKKQVRLMKLGWMNNEN